MCDRLVTLSMNLQADCSSDCGSIGIHRAWPKHGLEWCVPDSGVWRTEFDRWGLRRFVYLRLMSKLRRWLVLSEVRIRAQNAGASELGSSIDGCTVRLADRDDLIAAARDPRFGLVPADIDAALTRGDICAAAFAGERMVSYVWRSFSSARYGDDLWVEIQKPYRYGYKGFTQPEYRGRHIQNTVALFTDALCVARGHTHSLSLIETHNFASIQSEDRRHSQTAGWVGYIKIFGRTHAFRSPGARRTGLRLRRASDGAHGR